MNCQQVNKLLISYDEGKLPRHQAEEVMRHLDSCSNCRTLYHLVEKERIALQSREDLPDLSPGFTGAVMAAITPHPAPGLVPVWAVWSLRYATLLGAMAAVLLFILPLFNTSAKDQDRYILPQKSAQVAASNLVTSNAAPRPYLTENSTGGNSGYRPENRPEMKEGPSRSALTGTSSSKTESGAKTLQTNSGTAAAASTQTGNQNIPPLVMPTYNPPGYSLQEVNYDQGNHVALHFQAIKSETTPASLTITVAPVTAPELEKMKAATTASTATDIDQKLFSRAASSSDASQGTTDSGATSEVRTLAAPTGGAPEVQSYRFQRQGFTYQLTLDNSLPAEEIKQLIDSCQVTDPGSE